jgi:hypothetical protein
MEFVAKLQAICSTYLYEERNGSSKFTTNQNSKKAKYDNNDT